MQKLTQEEFSSRYDIELSTLESWEEGRSEPATLHMPISEPSLQCLKLYGTLYNTSLSHIKGGISPRVNYGAV